MVNIFNHFVKNFEMVVQYKQRKHGKSNIGNTIQCIYVWRKHVQRGRMCFILFLIWQHFILWMDTQNKTSLTECKNCSFSYNIGNTTSNFSSFHLFENKVLVEKQKVKQGDRYCSICQLLNPWTPLICMCILLFKNCKTVKL